MSTPEPAEAPRDWFHHHATQAEALERLERRVRNLELWVTAQAQAEAAKPQEAAEDAAARDRYTAPAGVVPPHVALNLRAIREWVDVALAGGDVPRP